MVTNQQHRTYDHFTGMEVVILLTGMITAFIVSMIGVITV